MARRPTLLLYPTSPVHLRGFAHLLEALPSWRGVGLLPSSLRRSVPGLPEAYAKTELELLEVEHPRDISRSLAEQAQGVLFGAAFERWALDLFAWAKERGLFVAAVEEVSQLALNDSRINNYDLPFDRLFVANAEERARFVALGYPSSMLVETGLIEPLATAPSATEKQAARASLGAKGRQRVVLYTTSPLRSRKAIHNLDCRGFRQGVYRQLAELGPEYHVVVKLHPNEDVEAERCLLEPIAPRALLVGRERRIGAVLAAADVVVNRGNSQTALQAVYWGIPTVVLACGVPTTFAELGGGRIVERVEELGPALREGTERWPDPRALRQRMWPELSAPPAETIARCLGTLSSADDDASWEWFARSLLFMGGVELARAVCRSHSTPFLAALRRALRLDVEEGRHAALDAWSDVGELSPDWYLVPYQRAIRALALGDPKLAITEADRAIVLHPPFHYLWHEVPMRAVQSEAYLALDRPQAARDVIAKLEPGVAEVLPEAQVALASIAAWTGDTPAALRSLDRAVELLLAAPLSSDADAVLLAQVGFTAHRAGELDRAAEFYKRALGMHSGAPVRRRLGDLCEHSGDYHGAARWELESLIHRRLRVPGFRDFFLRVGGLQQLLPGPWALRGIRLVDRAFDAASDGRLLREVAQWAVRQIRHGGGSRRT